LPDTTTAIPEEKFAKPAPAPPSYESQPDDRETALESLSSICTVLAVGLFVMTFVFQNYEIPSASMEKTL
jgi:signal peptidase I